MPFGNNKWRSFTRAEVENLNPGQVGMYGLARGQTWVYVGRGDIRARLLAHIAGDNTCIVRGAPTHWIDEVTANDVAREKQLVLELQPVCNLRLG